MNKFTGNKDTDFLILHQLTDNELGKVCQANKYVNSLCADNNFWLSRIIHTFKYLDSSKILQMKDYLGLDNFKELYQYLAGLSKIKGEKNWREMTYVHLNVEKIIRLIVDEKRINEIIDDSTKILPKWVNKQELIFQLRRDFPKTLLQMPQMQGNFYMATYLGKYLYPLSNNIYKSYEDINTDEFLISKRK